MTSAKMLDFWTPSPLSISHSRNLSVLSSAFQLTPIPSALSADVICERLLGVRWIAEVDGGACVDLESMERAKGALAIAHTIPTALLQTAVGQTGAENNRC